MSSGSARTEIEAARKHFEAEREAARVEELEKLKKTTENGTAKQVGAEGERELKKKEQEIQDKIEAATEGHLRSGSGAREVQQRGERDAEVREEVKLASSPSSSFSASATESPEQQQNLYEAVRSDRNLYSKNLIESQDEIAEMKRKFKIMNHQIEQLKEEIQRQGPGAREGALRAHEGRRRRRSAEELKNEAQGVASSMKDFELSARKKNLIDDATASVSEGGGGDKLNQIIKEADKERRAQQQKEYDVVVNERDILGTQLIRRNDELALLYEKIKIQRNARASWARAQGSNAVPRAGACARSAREEPAQRRGAAARAAHLKSQVARATWTCCARRCATLAARAAAGAHQGEGAVGGAREPHERAPLAQARGQRPVDVSRCCRRSRRCRSGSS